MPPKKIASGRVDLKKPIHTMLNKSTIQLMALGLIGSMAATSFADESALIDALVRKGVLKKGEAEQLRAQACKECASDKLSGKVSLGESVSSLKLTGDLRLRYQYSNDQDNQTLAASTNGSGTHNTGYRLRLRINADYKVDENFFAGFGLRTFTGGAGNIAPRGDEGRRSADRDLASNYYENYSIGISKAFIGWTPTPGITVIAGKQENPFYTTDMVWGSEVNPAGFTQQIDLNKVFGFSGISLKVNSGQFIVSDNTENDPAHNDNRDGFIWQTQVVASVDLGSSAKLTVAPGYYSSNGARSVAFGRENVANLGLTPDGEHLDNMQIVLLPGDVSTELAGQKVKFQWDLAYNLDGANRSKAILGNLASGSGTDKLAWLLGVQVGENKKKGDWSAVANYRRVGLSAVDHLITDADFAFGDVNATGFKVGFTYNVGNATTIGLNYYIVDNLRKDIGTLPGYYNTTAHEFVGSNSSQIIQADVSVKF